MEKSKTPTDQTHKTPRTLLEAVRYFAVEDVAHSYAATLRWPDGPSYPRCGCREYSYLTTRKLWKCKDRECRYQYSLKEGTIFEDSPLGFDKWLPAIWLLVNAKNGISSHELARALGIHQESAWHMLGRIRLAMELGSFETLKREIAADETYVWPPGEHAPRPGREVRRQAWGARQDSRYGLQAARWPGGRQGGSERQAPTLQAEICSRVEKGSRIYSDMLFSYTGLEDDYDHQIIDHARAYVEGRVSTNQTNQIENFWSLLKRALKGTYISVQPEHLQRYVTEEVCRFNARHDEDGGRFATVLQQVEGKRLTYGDLTAR
jgi:transposase-like protein